MHFSASLLATEYQNSSGCPTYAASTKSRWLRQGEPGPGGRGPRQARHGWRAPESGQDVLLREKRPPRSEEHTSELQSLMRTSYAVFCLKTTNSQKSSFTRM